MAVTNLGRTFDEAKRIRSFASVSQHLNTAVANEQQILTVHPVFERSEEDKERKFGSLEFKKHRCYSPTFYSMRCKKHAKRRPVIYAIPKDCQKSKSSDALFVFKGSSNFENLTDSIQVMEQKPKPKPRCKRHRRNSCRIYENIRDVLQKDTSTTHAVVHKSDSEVECYNTDGGGCKRLNVSLHKSAPDIFNNHVKVSPTRVKPATVSPKGALYMQLKAKKRTPPNPEPTPNLNSKDVALSVPQMPLLEPKNMRTSKLNKVVSPSYSNYFINKTLVFTTNSFSRTLSTRSQPSTTSRRQLQLCSIQQQSRTKLPVSSCPGRFFKATSRCRRANRSPPRTSTTKNTSRYPCRSAIVFGTKQPRATSSRSRTSTKRTCWGTATPRTWVPRTTGREGGTTKGRRWKPRKDRWFWRGQRRVPICRVLWCSNIPSRCTEIWPKDDPMGLSTPT